MALLNLRSSRQLLLVVTLGAGSAVQLGAGTASAQTAASDKVAAEALFDEARALMKEGKYEEACPKLVDSQRLDPGVGTLLYLASCHEKSGKLATAWVTFREAAAAAHRANQPDREKTATARADALTPLLPRLKVEPNTSAGEPEITRDGVPVTRASWGTPIPVDPGAHVIKAQLAGHKPWSVTIDAPKGETVTVAVPALEREPAATSPAPIAPPTEAAAEPSSATSSAPSSGEAQPSSVRRALPYAAAGVGAAGVVVGTIFGLRAFSLASSVEETCPSGPCSGDAVAQANDSRTAGDVSTVAFAVGAVALGAAAVLWLTEPSRAPRARASVRGFTF